MVKLSEEVAEALKAAKGEPVSVDVPCPEGAFCRRRSVDSQCRDGGFAVAKECGAAS